MDLEIKENFLSLWQKYFDGAELPLVFYYADQPEGLEVEKKPSAHTCIICQLSGARKGKPLCFNLDSISCAGGRRYLGFSQDIRPNFEYFLSCGIPGKLEGERYKKTPELVKQVMKKMPPFKAPSDYIIFKRWDLLKESQEPEVAIFFSEPDTLSGLFTLASFDEAESGGVIAPFSSGCGSIVYYPYQEGKSKSPRCVIGMFDPSARPCVPEDVISFSVPAKKFCRMIENMEESFLITSTWNKIRKRIAKLHL